MPTLALCSPFSAAWITCASGVDFAQSIRRRAARIARHERRNPQKLQDEEISQSYVSRLDWILNARGSGREWTGSSAAGTASVLCTEQHPFALLRQRTNNHRLPRILSRFYHYMTANPRREMNIDHLPALFQHVGV